MTLSDQAPEVEVTGIGRAGIRSVLNRHVHIRDNHTHHNGYWGIFTGHVNDLLIENNKTSGSTIEHGIYVSFNDGASWQSLRLNLTQSFGDRLRAQINTNAIRTVTRRGISNNDNANITPYFVLAATPSWFDMRPRDGSYPTNPFAGTNSFQNVDRIETPSLESRGQRPTRCFATSSRPCLPHVTSRVWPTRPGGSRRSTSRSRRGRRPTRDTRPRGTIRSFRPLPITRTQPT